MKIKLLIFFILLFISTLTIGQSNKDSIYHIVLNKNITDSLYVFGKWNTINSTETHLKYLGSIKNNNNIFKIIISSWFWGASKRATNKILVFNQNNHYLGNYYLTTKSDLPKKIENNKIIFFNNEDNNCDNKIVNSLSFNDGIPKEFFLECKNGLGSIYSFNKE